MAHAPDHAVGQMAGQSAVDRPLGLTEDASCYSPNGRIDQSELMASLTV